MKCDRILLALVLTFLLPAVLRADQASLDKLVRQEQAEVDNEAVVVYGGTVGKLEAVFHLEWAGKEIDGRYYYPSRGREKRYKLKGTNPKDGVMMLEEFTVKEPGLWKLSATCRLTKRVTKSRILWEGKMNNTDGRQLPISFSRKR